MQTDKEFNTLLIKLIFCDDNMSYVGYSGALQETKTVKNLIEHVLNRINIRKKLKLTLADELSFSISNDDPDMLDIYIGIKDVDIDQIMIPIRLDDIKNQPESALLFPGEEEIKL